jgi:hypothetical protein
MPKKSEAEGSFAARFLIILLAAGIVAIGLNPMKGNLRRVTQSAKHFVEENLSFLSAKNKETENPNGSRAMMLDSNELLTQPAPRKPKHIEDVSKNPPKQPVDRLTPNDRKELNDLVNSF